MLLIFISFWLLFLVVKLVKWVLVKFKEFKELGFEWDNKMLVSSANKIGTDLSFTNLGKSFINMEKSKGPKAEPRGTPCFIFVQVDVVILPFSLYSNVL